MEQTTDVSAIDALRNYLEWQKARGQIWPIVAPKPSGPPAPKLVGYGNPSNPRIVFVCDSPDSDVERLFVKPAQNLLDRMIAAMALPSSSYFVTVLFSEPATEDNPADRGKIATFCEALRALEPEIIVACGERPSTLLTGATDFQKNVGAILPCPGLAGIPVTSIHGPREMLADPALKKPTWSALQELMKMLPSS